MAEQNTVLRQILDKLQDLEETTNAQLIALDHENKNRAKEIENLARNLKATVLTDDASVMTRVTITGDEDEVAPTARSRQPPSVPPMQPVVQLMRAKDTMKFIETLRGRDDVRVEHFIKSVRFARNNCSEKATLLKLLLIEKITENTKQSIRYTTIETYEVLYETLRRNVSIPKTVSNCRAKLQQIRQGATESIQSYNLRFRQQLNELIYTVQNKHTRPISREIAIEEEESEAVRTYILNLHRDIGILVIPSKPMKLIDAQKVAADMELWMRDTNRVTERRPPLHKTSATAEPKTGSERKSAT